MRKRANYLFLLLFLIACSNKEGLSYEDAENAREELNKYSDFTCQFPEGKFTVFSKTGTNTKNTEFSNSIVLQITNSKEGQGKLIGNIGVAQVKVLSDPIGITFIEVIPAGGYSLITVFGTKRKGSNEFLSIFSKHNSTVYFPQSSQYYGSCAGLQK